MLRVILTALVAAAIGIALGSAQSSLQTSGLDETFLGTRPTIAELKGGYDGSKSEGTPKVEVVGSSDYEFGMMMHGETQSHSFEVRNAGDGPLVLDMRGSTCKCTVGDMEKDVLAPGESTKITLTWTAQSVLPVYGQSATFGTNDPNVSELKFAVRGMIADSFVIEPKELALGDVPVDQETTKTFYVFTYLKDSVELKDFAWTNADTRELVEIESAVVALADTPFPQHHNALVAHKIDLKLKPGLPLGPMTSRIQFETDRGEEIGKLELLAAGRVTSAISLLGGSSFDAEMSVIDFGNVKSIQGASVGIFLSLQGEDRVNIVPEIASWTPKEAMHVTLGEPRVTESRTMYPIQVEVPKGTAAVSFPGNSKDSFGKITIKTNHETIREIPIYVRLVVEE